MYNFNIIRPKFFHKQDALHSWLSEVHARSERNHLPPLKTLNSPSYASSSGYDGTAALKIRDSSDYLRMFNRFGCSSELIQYRGFELEDFTHLNWDKMKIARLDKSAKGEGFTERMKIYSSSTERIFGEFY
jgi:hypothetical protein